MIKSIKFVSVIFSALLLGCSNPTIKPATQAIDLIELEYPDSLSVIRRAEWGWLPISKPFDSHNIKYITVHHGGVEFSVDKNPAEHVKNLQTWSVNEKNWIDIPYHFMIDLEGNIYETRPINIPGDTNTEYDPTSHLLVEVMGNYEIQTMSEIQLTTLVDLLRFLSKRFNVPSDHIKTHRDYSTQTVCPGENIYQYFSNGTIKRQLNGNTRQN